jgi:hypothetical protein
MPSTTGLMAVGSALSVTSMRIIGVWHSGLCRKELNSLRAPERPVRVAIATYCHTKAAKGQAGNNSVVHCKIAKRWWTGRGMGRIAVFAALVALFWV